MPAGGSGARVRLRQALRRLLWALRGQALHGRRLQVPHPAVRRARARGGEADAPGELLPPDHLPAGEAAQAGGPAAVRGAARGEAVPHRRGGVHEAQRDQRQRPQGRPPRHGRPQPGDGRVPVHLRHAERARAGDAGQRAADGELRQLLLQGVPHAHGRRLQAHQVPGGHDAAREDRRPGVRARPGVVAGPAGRAGHGDLLPELRTVRAAGADVRTVRDAQHARAGAGGAGAAEGGVHGAHRAAGEPPQRGGAHRRPQARAPARRR
mmetsp:Transcript_20734/g.45431  ORF Transcript_20734/g.45431 Transcript_20734/m.45431 type:complete len:266 (+) Transcript_20734:306-1103(+)